MKRNVTICILKVHCNEPSFPTENQVHLVDSQRAKLSRGHELVELAKVHNKLQPQLVGEGVREKYPYHCLYKVLEGLTDLQ